MLDGGEPGALYAWPAGAWSARGNSSSHAWGACVPPRGSTTHGLAASSRDRLEEPPLESGGPEGVRDGRSAKEAGPRHLAPGRHGWTISDGAWGAAARRRGCASRCPVAQVVRPPDARWPGALGAPPPALRLRRCAGADRAISGIVCAR